MFKYFVTNLLRQIKNTKLKYAIFCKLKKLILNWYWKIANIESLDKDNKVAYKLLNSEPKYFNIFDVKADTEHIRQPILLAILTIWTWIIRDQ